MNILEKNQQEIRKAEELMNQGKDKEAEEILHHINPASDEQERTIYQMLKAIRLGW